MKPEELKDENLIPSNSGGLKPQPFDEIGKAWEELVRMGYGNDMNVFSVMHELQQKFKKP